MNYFIWRLVGPASWPLWLLLGSALASARRPDAARHLAVAGALILFLFGLLPTGRVLIERLESAYPLPASLPAGLQHIVVLTGGERLALSNATGRLQIGEHGDRITEAVALARATPGARLWVVGGLDGGGPRRDVDWSADYFHRAGVAPARIGIIGGTTDTCSNAAGIRTAIGDDPILLVTSAFHLPRAMACMRTQGVTAIAFGVDRQAMAISSWRDGLPVNLIENLRLTDLALHEYAGLLWYRLTGRIA
jgi:uncharacterized SAM-binding protein YcdF (DUF218 family)